MNAKFEQRDGYRKSRNGHGKDTEKIFAKSVGTMPFNTKATLKQKFVSCVASGPNHGHSGGCKFFFFPFFFFFVGGGGVW